MTVASTGVLSHTFTDPEYNLTYNYTVILVHLGETYTYTGEEVGSTGVEPVTLAEAKLHLKVDTDADDDLITSLIVAAREICEAETWRRLYAGTEVEKFDYFPANGFRLTWSPLRAVTSIQYVDTNGDTQTLSADYYDVDTTSEPGRITLAYDYSWPSTRSQHHAITVTYTSGYASSSSVPDALKAAMKLLIGTWYDNRESVVVGQRLSAMPMPDSAKYLMSSQSLRSFYE